MKERFKAIFNKDELGYCIIDTEDDFRDEMHSLPIIADLLNELDQKIKELYKRLISRSQDETLKELYKKCTELKEIKIQLEKKNNMLQNKIDLLENRIKTLLY